MNVIWESLPAADTQSVRLLRLEQDAFSGPLHVHEAIELTWIERGRGLRFVGDSVEPFEEGDLVLLGPRVAHTWHTSGPQHGRVRVTVLQLLLRPELDAFPEWRQAMRPLLARANAAWRIDAPLADTVRAALLAMPADDNLALLGGALALLGRLAAAQSGMRPVRAGPLALPLGEPGRRIDALLAWIRANLQAELRVADAAALLHVTPAAFSRSFQRLVGKPFSVYVNDLRIAEACLLLARSDRPVAEIARRCGYATLSNFNHHFRSRLGLAPRAYRAARSATSA